VIFVDASGWYALLSEKDVHHGEVRECFTEIAKGRWGAPLTTDYVLDEAFTLLRLRWGIAPVRTLARLLAESPTVRRIRIGEEGFEGALELMLSHADKKWSFTDCTSFVTMRETGVRRAVTLDHNFSEAGFEMLPKR
jgi:predicted nucleic acid-binding protein